MEGRGAREPICMTCLQTGEMCDCMVLHLWLVSSWLQADTTRRSAQRQTPQDNKDLRGSLASQTAVVDLPETLINLCPTAGEGLRYNTAYFPLFRHQL